MHRFTPLAGLQSRPVLTNLMAAPLRVLVLAACVLGMALSLYGQAARAATDDIKQAPPHIALILPLQSKKFGATAEIVKAGVQMGMSKLGKDSLPLQIYPIANEASDIYAAYRDAVESGAQVIIGPLTKPGIKALLSDAASIKATILLLNTLDADAPRLPNVFSLNLSAEAEARQVAQWAWKAGYRKIVTVTVDNGLYVRLQQAFVDEWLTLGGIVGVNEAIKDTKTDWAGFRRRQAECACDAFFIAADPRMTRLARPNLPLNLPVFATSQAFDGRLSSPSYADLQGLHFLDMPWLLTPLSASVGVYARHTLIKEVDEERLYALGIDAARLADQLSKSHLSGIVLDGVTGQLTLGANGTFERSLLPATVNGDVVTVEPPSSAIKP